MNHIVPCSSFPVAYGNATRTLSPRIVFTSQIELLYQETVQRILEIHAKNRSDSQTEIKLLFDTEGGQINLQSLLTNNSSLTCPP